MKKNNRSFQKLRLELLMSWYTHFLDQDRLKENWILLDSRVGKDLGSNLLTIAREISTNPEYKGYRIWISAQKAKRKEIQEICQCNHLQRVKLVSQGEFTYGKVLALAKYIFTDATLPVWYEKKEGQVYTQVGMGTPLKKLGRDLGNQAFDMGNAQKSYLMADYLLMPNDYSRELYSKAYFLDPLYGGELLCCGNLGNAAYFQPERSQILREELHLEGKKVYGYLPARRTGAMRISAARMCAYLEYYFAQLDAQLTDEEVFLVHLHPLMPQKVETSGYKHIRTVPGGYDINEVLNLCDALVTDYSGAMFDYGNTGRKIVLFVYDKEFYLNGTDCYLSLDDLPFPQVRRVDQLLEQLRTPKDYEDEEFRKTYCAYDERKAPAKVCRQILKGERMYPALPLAHPSRENVLVYVGSLAKNGLTTAFFNLMELVDHEKRNYIVTFRTAIVKKEPQRLENIPEGMPFLPIASVGCETFGESRALTSYFQKNQTSTSIQRKVDHFFRRLYERNAGFCKIDQVIHYSGYEKDMINMFQMAPVRKMIFVHNDMVAEMKLKNNQHPLSLSRAYATFDQVVPVTKDIEAPTRKIAGASGHITVVNNCHDYQTVRRKAEMPLAFEDTTECNRSEGELRELLDSDVEKFITIGRFSPEKGHDLLLKAFQKYWKDHRDSYLIVIGGYGTLYPETLKLAMGLPCWSHIVMIKSIRNPMPILAACDLFLLSSLHEGLGLVLLEADTLGIPVISTDVVGPRGFMTEHGGHLVPATVKGLYQGMLDYEEGKVSVMHVDYEELNQKAVAGFEALF